MRHSYFCHLEFVNILLIANLVKELTGVFHVIPDSTTLHWLHEPELIPLAEVRLVQIVI